MSKTSKSKISKAKLRRCAEKLAQEWYVYMKWRAWADWKDARRRLWPHRKDSNFEKVSAARELKLRYQGGLFVIREEYARLVTAVRNDNQVLFNFNFKHRWEYREE
jgi:hypothetical protein